MKKNRNKAGSVPRVQSETRLPPVSSSRMDNVYGTIPSERESKEYFP